MSYGFCFEFYINVHSIRCLLLSQYTHVPKVGDPFAMGDGDMMLSCVIRLLKEAVLKYEPVTKLHAYFCLFILQKK